MTQIGLRIECADPDGLLQRISRCDIPVCDIIREDALRLRIRVPQKNMTAIMRMAEKFGGSCQICQYSAESRLLRFLRRRWLILTGAAFLLFMTLLLPRYVFFIQVTGNQSVSANVIAEQAEMFGLHFGTERRAIESQKIKNGLLENIPALEWVGVNTSGCVAVIEVREKKADSGDSGEKAAVSHLTAAVDGVVDSVTATAGKALCVPGQAVYKGQILISGYEDCGLAVRAVNAGGEIYAFTRRQFNVILDGGYYRRRDVKRVQTRYFLQIGKKLIKFSKDSGISPDSCVKIYATSDVVLPGGFVLPVSLIREQHLLYETQQAQMDDREVGWLTGYAERYLQSQMLGGSVLERNLELVPDAGRLILSCQYTCHEQIGRVTTEEILPNE